MVTEIAYSRAAVAANLAGVSLRDFTESALDVAVANAEREYQGQQYEAACREAIDRKGIRPTRHEWDRQQKHLARRAVGMETNQTGRALSRPHRNTGEHCGVASNAGVKSRQPNRL